MDDSIKIPCLFIPVKRFNLLLPNSAIAEVLAISSIDKISGDLPWLAGTIKWQNTTLAVIAFDNLEKENHSNNPDNSIILVIRNPNPKNALPFFGLIVKTLPQVIEANNFNIDVNPQPSSTHPFALVSILVNEKEALIPNIEVLSKFITNNQEKFLPQKQDDM